MSILSAERIQLNAVATDRTDAIRKAGDLLVKSGCADTYCFGDEPSLADICLVPHLFNARRFQCKLDECPTLVRIDENCQLLPAVQEAWPKETVT